MRAATGSGRERVPGHPPEDDLKLLQWSDEQLDGKGYIDWYPFEHDQLGWVELGGWDLMYCWGNVPPQFLEREIAPHSELAIWHLLVSPRLETRSLDVESLGDFADVSRALVVTAWSWGAGLARFITPTSAVVMAGLALAGVRYDRWIRFMLPWMGLLAVASVVMLATAALLE